VKNISAIVVASKNDADKLVYMLVMTGWHQVSAREKVELRCYEAVEKGGLFGINLLIINVGGGNWMVDEVTHICSVERDRKAHYVGGLTRNGGLTGNAVVVSFDDDPEMWEILMRKAPEGTLIRVKLEISKLNPKSECVNPHEQIYRGCTEKCEFFKICEAKPGGSWIGFEGWFGVAP
jgi:hypothetical protein